MKKIKVQLKYKNYSIIINNGIISSIPSYHKLNFSRSKAFIISDKNVSNFYLKILENKFKSINIKYTSYIIEPGEKSKSFQVLQKISDELLKDKISRNDIIYALGGGVVGDLSGFLSSIILRGVRFIQVPTTLLSQVDSSVGGKTGINTLAGKNLIGTFHQPEFVFIDTNTLRTLPKDEYLAGYAEVVKYALINDKSFFKWLDLNSSKIKKKDELVIEKIIYKCCKNKSKIVALDEKEKGQRMLLNLGHTFGHAIEAELNFSIKHGFAVSLGILMALDLSINLGYLKLKDFKSISKHLKNMSLPTRLKDLSNTKKWKPSNLLIKMQNDKKIINNELTFILCKGIGNSFINYKVKKDKILQTIENFI